MNEQSHSHCPCAGHRRRCRHAGERQRQVYLPQGQTWTNVWDGQAYEGGQTVTVDAPLDQIPVFAREESLLSLFQEG